MVSFKFTILWLQYFQFLGYNMRNPSDFMPHRYNRRIKKIQECTDGRLLTKDSVTHASWMGDLQLYICTTWLYRSYQKVWLMSQKCKLCYQQLFVQCTDNLNHCGVSLQRCRHANEATRCMWHMLLLSIPSIRAYLYYNISQGTRV